jgi:pyridoxal phosphate enzyme (YggS family)
MVDVGGNYRGILDRITAAAEKVRRDPGAVRLLAAAKSQSVEAIRAALAAGVTLVGENYVQEAADKKKQISASIEWHMIGHLQRNKARAALDLFDLVESLDNLALARELDKEGAKRDKTIRAFVEVNLGGEASKSGVAQEQVHALMEALSELSHLSIEGLMTVPPFRENLEDVRPYFRALRELRDSLAGLHLPNVELKELSMGMTHDFTVAIEEGATIVRIGTALFGPRKA